MKIQIKYNKTALKEFQKKLKIRERALPTLKNKEAALRAMVIDAKKELLLLNNLYDLKLRNVNEWEHLWAEFNPNIVAIEEIISQDLKVAGLVIPEFRKLKLRIGKFSVFGNPNWFYNGIDELKIILETRVKREFQTNKLSLLEYARKKATQKVNLYEKVQIPTLSAALKQIKRYLEDEENLAKAGQKLLKQRILNENRV